MPITIPNARQPALTREPRNLFIYSKPKVGKTVLCSKLPNALHVDTEEGTGFVECARVTINSPEEAIELAEKLPAAWRANPFRFLVIDVVDTLEDWSEQIATGNYKRLPMGKNFQGDSVLELDKGAGYRFLREAFKGLVFKFMGNAMWSTIFLGHIRDKYSDANSKLGTQVVEGDVDLTGKIKSIMCARVDAIGYLYRDAAGALKLCFDTKDVINCGNRAPYLAGKTLTFSTPPKSEEWAQLFPDTWNKAPVVPGTPPLTPVVASPVPAPAAPASVPPIPAPATLKA